MIAFAIFIGVNGVNSVKRQEAARPRLALEPGNEEKLRTEIRDLLKAKNGP